MIIDYPFIFWSILSFFIVTRLLIPIKSQYIQLDIQVNETKEWRKSRTQNIMLASFSMVALAVSATMLQNNISLLQSTFFYFAVSMFCFLVQLTYTIS